MSRIRVRLEGTQLNGTKREPMMVLGPDFSGGLCDMRNGANPDDWFAAEVTDRMLVQACITICKRCPMTDECLAYALEHDIAEGVWGGIPASERQKSKRQLAWSKRQARFNGARKRSA